MATTPSDPTEQRPSPERVRRIESLISSLLGVTRSRVDRDGSGAIRSLHASVAPGHSPHRVRREIRSALLSSLDLDLAIEVVDVEVEEQRGRRQEQFWEGPERDQGIGVVGEDASRSAGTRNSRGGDDLEEARVPEEEIELPGEDTGDTEDSEGTGLAEAATPAPDEEPRVAEAGTAHGPEEWQARADAPPGSRKGPPSGASPRGEAQGASGSADRGPTEVFERRTPGDARGSTPSTDDEGSPADVPPVPPQEASGPAGLLPLRLGEYVLLGGGGKDAGVELRIRVMAGEDGFAGTVRVGSLEDVSPGIFVGATLRAVERALDARPVSERSDRILILEAVDMEEVFLREGRFIAATVQAVHRDRERRATGLVPAEGRSLREAAAEAALDAVTRILQDRHTRRVEGRGRIRRDGGGLSGGSRDRSGPEGSRSDRGSEGRATQGGSDARGPVERDPFHVWE